MTQVQTSTSPEQLQVEFKALKKAYNLHPAPTLEERVRVLKTLKQSLIENE